MNKSKWRGAPLAHLVIKLAEETGEVAKEYSMLQEGVIFDRTEVLGNIVKEAEHVMFIAEQTKEQALAMMTTRVS